MNSRLMKFALAAGSACIVALSAVAPAQAAVYRGTFDPAYDTSRFPDLGYRGSATFYVPNACLGGPAANVRTQVVDSISACSFGAMSMLTAQVVFYSLSTPSNIIETVTFAPPVYNPDPVYSAWILYNNTAHQNRVVGMTTTLFGPAVSSTAIPGHFLSMAFNDTAVTVLDKSPACNSNPLCSGSLGNPTVFSTFAPVPEPSIALTSVVGLLGLGAYRLFARRRGA